MSVRLGNRIIAGGRPINKSALYLFDFKWSDHLVNQQEWLRADTFTWHDGTTYSDAYQHLVDDVDGKTTQTETIAGTTITFYLADDGHKIVDSSQEANVGQIFLDTGVAWYYILDETNTRFKLPRTEHGVVGVRGNVGDYVEAGLPDIYGNVGINDGQPDNVLFKSNGYQGTWPYGSSATNRPKIQFKASDYNSIYGNSTTVQPPATQMYLYFYVGEFTQTAKEQTAGITAETLNQKADLSMFQVVTALPATPNPNTIYFVVNP